ncbi:PREDICTED: uncharacterized protein LOC109237709 [Nicotiana attenuata]|uniref:Uncharacterized protein n=1 Tax=Nicotiana attenuata TaxID=49451 RepID=A0A314LDU0_NICAT|nr:PREDICTED: uncharacterized protein LOC109237709 [Nicotiana attenuata]OIT39736.1 hypothetical protein A4A49_04879 [Nicotiana attenuata]
MRYDWRVKPLHGNKNWDKAVYIVQSDSLTKSFFHKGFCCRLLGVESKSYAETARRELATMPASFSYWDMLHIFQRCNTSIWTSNINHYYNARCLINMTKKTEMPKSCQLKRRFRGACLVTLKISQHQMRNPS